jgi:hypothetical protein
VSEREWLDLKWGTLKGWNFGENKAAMAALEKYHDDPVSVSAIMQKHTQAQKLALCDMIDAVNGPITNNWTGKMMTPAEAKTYVMEYNTP